MKSITAIITAFIFTSLACSATVYAVEKRYVTDKLFLQLRTGPSQEFRILKALQSGEHLIFIEEDDESGYTKVKTDKDLEGWVLTRFLVNEPIAREKLILANRELDSVKSELSTLKSQNESVQSQLNNTSNQSADLQKENAELQAELERIKAISANAISLDQKNKQLSTRTQELEIRMEALTAENQQLLNDQRTTFLIYGGILVAGGIFAGLILPAFGGKKRNSGWA